MEESLDDRQTRKEVKIKQKKARTKTKSHRLTSINADARVLRISPVPAMTCAGLVHGAASRQRSIKQVRTDGRTDGRTNCSSYAVCFAKVS